VGDVIHDLVSIRMQRHGVTPSASPFGSAADSAGYGPRYSSDGQTLDGGIGL
jgi:hypothetical protein